MKAIKLASVFAVSAVAVAVSTTTFAAEPVFSGTAGLKYTSNESDSDAAGSKGELNITVDTGVVYIKMDMEKNSINGTDDDGDAATYTDGGFDLDAAYVKQGAVKFGDFDGSLIDGAAYNAGVEEDNDTKQTFGDDLGVRYAVSDDLSVAVEMIEGDDTATLAFSYSTEFSGLTLGVSGGHKMSDDDLADQILTVGLKAPLGMATLSTFVQLGSEDDLDVLTSGIGLDLPVSEQLSVALQYYTDGGESAKGVDKVDQGVAEASVFYTAGDITYYASLVSKDAAASDYSVVGAKASF